MLPEKIIVKSITRCSNSKIHVSRPVDNIHSDINALAAIFLPSFITTIVICAILRRQYDSRCPVVGNGTLHTILQ